MAVMAWMVSVASKIAEGKAFQRRFERVIDISFRDDAQKDMGAADVPDLKGLAKQMCSRIPDNEILSAREGCIGRVDKKFRWTDSPSPAIQEA